MEKINYTILIVEDNPGDLFLITDYLEDAISEPTIINADTFNSAVSLITSAQYKFDVILLDLSLSDKSRIELISGILDASKEIPVIVLTGYSDIDFGVKSLSMGISDYLLKDELVGSTLLKSIVYSIERKKINTALLESEKRYSSLFQMSPLPMWVMDFDTYKYVQVNKAAVDKYGFSNVEFMSMTVFDLRPDFEFEKTRTNIQNISSGKISTPFLGCHKHMTKDKRLLDVDIYGNKININDKQFLLIIGFDITEKTQHELMINQAILNAQEEERYEIGAELHDNICQLLNAGLLWLSMLDGEINENARDMYNRAIEVIKLSMEDTRRLSHSLAPSFLEASYIQDTFLSLLNNFNAHEQYIIDLDISSEVKSTQINKDIHLHLYRILQEQLNNIRKYANATKISVKLLFENNLFVLDIIDNGKGEIAAKENEKTGIGFSNMKRRLEPYSGQLEINPNQINGFEIRIKIPKIKFCDN